MRKLSVFKGKTFFVSGASGVLGSALVRELEKIGCRVLTKPHKFVCSAKKINVKDKIDYIVHAAAPTSSKFFVEKPIETIEAIYFGTKNTLELAKEHKVKGYLFLSSLEIYGIPQEINVSEADGGYIDTMNVRSSYNEGKRLAECLCASYAKKFGVNAKVARLAQCFGEKITEKDNRVFAEFARAAKEGKPIVLKTKGETIRNYCSVRDAVNAMLVILAKGKNGEAYNVANKNSACSILELAKMFSKDIVFDIKDSAEKLGYAPTVKIVLNCDKLEKLGWKAEIGLEEMVANTMEK
jgi:dTDP-glucose 4,6-dehydratase